MDEIEVTDALSAALKMQTDAERLLKNMTTAAMNERKNFYKREEIAPNFVRTYLRAGMAALTWYEVYAPADDMILRRAVISNNMTYGQFYFLALAPIPEVISGSLTGMNNSTRIIAAGIADGVGSVMQLDFGKAGLLVPRGWNLRGLHQIATYAMTATLHFVAKTPGICYSYF